MTISAFKMYMTRIKIIKIDFLENNYIAYIYT